MKLASLGSLNALKRPRETHPLTWRLNQTGKTVWLEQYYQKDGYNAARKAVRNMTAEKICELVKQSGLKGRGGAGFSTGTKWSLTLKGDGIPQGYVICNADEMEPNTYKDRLLMEQNPHQVLEGIIIAGYANNARRGYIFIRGEYVDAARIVKKAVNELYEAGVLGARLLGTDYAFDIVVHTGAGRYICGEETALLNSLEGKRANPRAKPPFPGQVGAWGKPTVVNNVETLSSIPDIIQLGSHWYQGLKKPVSDDHGTKLMGFTGRVKNPGLWELPLGTSVREIFEDYAGGMKDGYYLKAWQPGGASTGFLLPDDLDVPMCSNGLETKNRRMGTALAMAVDDTVKMIDLLCNIETFFARESCGWCTPCREGLPLSVRLLSALRDGHGQLQDIEQLQEISKLLKPGNTFCGLAPGASEPLGTALILFKKELESCLMEGG